MNQENTDKKIKVLVIDDDNNLNVVLVDKLNASGFEAQGAADGEEGLKKAFELHPDVVLLDVLMPKMDGWEVLKQLKADEWGKDAKVIMLTVLEDVDNIARAVQGGSNEYFIKTNYSLEDVVGHVKRAVEQK
jgi:DNA-binding response OmpR family regulator